MKTLTMKVPVISIRPITFSVKSPISWTKFANLFNRATGEKFSVAELKKIVAGSFMILFMCSEVLFPVALLPMAYLIWKGGLK